MRSPLVFFAFIFAAELVYASDTKPNQAEIDTWRFPGATAAEKGRTNHSVNDPARKQSVQFGFDQFETTATFREVVGFYIRKTGLRTPNDSIVGREFPGDKICIPAHFSQTDAKGQNLSVTLLHNIRKNGATATFLVTNHPELGAITVTISRSQDEKVTTVQMVQHSEKFLN